MTWNYSHSKYRKNKNKARNFFDYTPIYKAWWAMKIDYEAMQFFRRGALNTEKDAYLVDPSCIPRNVRKGGDYLIYQVRLQARRMPT